MSELNDIIRDYIGEEKVQEIVEDECRMTIRKFFQHDVERKIANTMYAVAFKIVDEAFTENGRDLREELVERMKGVIRELPAYFIFRRKDVYESRNSVAQDVLEEEARNARPLIRERVEAAIAEYDIGRLTEDDVQDVLYAVIRDKLFGSGDGGERTDGAFA